jgi:hypothetical protein
MPVAPFEPAEVKIVERQDDAVVVVLSWPVDHLLRKGWMPLRVAVSFSGVDPVQAG